ncbi:methyltransferase domain-containing protein [Kocuria soli]|uniref:Methyltransferase domain-containing protein n=1 Tax=Kocuria soli TaxID=2485125 RepID=A0A3N3ZY23_9MICC|nr:methyltransferase domain-containing protein [Kocuria soli]ROZ63608.1 methyltransferase domain-containing protein [Kocuria soli]
MTPEGRALVDGLGPYRERDALAHVTRLRAEGVDPEVAAAAVTQSRLRTAAAEKFGDRAPRMFFTRAGLEQATRHAVADLHARRFAAAGVANVADLGCGIGADAIALAERGLGVVAVELDPTTAAVASANLADFRDTTVVCGDVLDLGLDDLPGGRPEAVWLDPARRTPDRPESAASHRLFDPEAFSPPLSFVEALAATGMPVGVKLGPGLPHDAIPSGCEAQWVSHRGDVVEVVLWFNTLAREGVRRAATVMDDDGRVHELTSAEDFPQGPTDAQSQGSPSSEPTSEASSEPTPRGVPNAGELLWEPDGAVIRAGLVQELAADLGAQLLHPRIAYLVGLESEDATTASPFARAYRIREVLPHTVKVLKTWVKTNQVGTLEIKKRGTDVTPEQLRKQLKPKGPNRATLILTRVATDDGERRVVLVADPVR